MDGLVSIINRIDMDTAETVVHVITSPINVTGYVLLVEKVTYIIYMLYTIFGKRASFDLGK